MSVEEDLDRLMRSHYPSLTDTKLSTLSDRKAEKLERLSAKTSNLYINDTLTGMQDSDSFTTANIGATRTKIPNVDTYYDGIEGAHYNDGVLNPEVDMYGVSKADRDAGAFGKSDKVMTRQREEVARLLNKDAATVTEQDFIDVSNQQQIQKLANLSGESGWEAPLIRDAVPTNLTGAYLDEQGQLIDDESVSLNVPIQTATFGKTGNRTLTAFADEQGRDVTTTDALDPDMNLNARQVSFSNSPMFTDEDISDIVGPKSYGSNLASGVKGALGSAAAKVGDMGIDFILRAGKELAEKVDGLPEEQVNIRIKNLAKKYGIGDVVNSKGNFIALDKYKEMSEYGYDDTRIKEYGDEFKKVIGGDASILEKAWVVAKGVQHFPEVLATSAGEMALAALPGGMAVLAASTTNDFLEERVKIKGTSDLDIEDYTIAGSMGIIYAAVNQFTKGMAGLKPTAKMAKDITAGLSAVGAKEVVAKMSGMLVNGSFKGFEEGVEEIIQGMSEVVGTKYATAKEDEILTKDTVLDLGLQATLGMGAGVGSSVAGDTVANTTKVVGRRKELTDKIAAIGKEVKSKPKAMKITPEQEATHTALGNLSNVIEANPGATASAGNINKILDKIYSYDIAENDKAGIQAVGKLKTQLADRASENKIDVNDLNLGSEPEVESFIGDMFDNATDVESDTLMDNMLEIANKYGISEERVKILKDSATVEKEATTGTRGYNTYDRTLTRLSKDPKGNSEAIQKVSDQVEVFYDSQVDRLDKLTKAVAEIQADIVAGTQPDGSVSVSGVKTVSGYPYKIHIKNGKINPATIGGINTKGNKVNGVLADVQRTIKGLEAIIEKHAINLDEKSKDPYSPKSKFRVPKVVKGEKARLGFWSNLNKRIDVEETIFTPEAWNKRSDLQMKVANKLNSRGYVEVNAKGHPVKGSGRWVPKSKVVVDKTIEKEELTKKQAKETAKQIKSIAKKIKSGTELTKEEKVFKKEHEAEIRQILKERNIVEELDSIEAEIDGIQNELKVATNKKEVRDLKAALKKKRAQKKAILDGRMVQFTLGKSISTTFDGFTSPIGEWITKEGQKKRNKDAIKFVHPTNINEYLQGSKSPTLLGSVYVKNFSNKVVKKSVKEIPGQIANLLRKVTRDKKYKQYDEEYNLASSPARGIIFDNDGDVNENVAVALDAALTDYLAMGYSNLGRKNKAEVARMIGKQEHEVTPKMLKYFQDKGNYSKNMADDVGKATLSNLGLRASDNIPQDLYAKLVADLGNIAMLMGVQNGDLELTDIKLAEHNRMLDPSGRDMVEAGSKEDKTTIPFIAYSKKGKDSIDKYKAKFEAFEKAIKVESKFERGPTKEAKPSTRREVRNNDVTEQSDLANETLNVLREEKYVKQESVVNWLIDLDNRKAVLGHLGFKTDKEMKKMSFNAAESASAKNDEIMRSLEFLENNELDEMYFDWFYAKSGRYFMDSNTLNPQTDKLHRFAIVPDAHKVTIDTTDNDHMDLFYTAIAQAFGMATDKETTDDVRAFGKRVTEMDADSLLEALKEGPLPDGIKVEHLSHYLQGVEAIRSMKASKDGTFETHLSMESDAVTSGFGLKLLQLPILEDVDGKMSIIEKTKQWMAKTGLFVDQTVDSMNDEVSKSDFDDAYETLAKEVNTDRIDQNSADYAVRTVKGKDGKDYEKDPWKDLTKYDKQIKHEVFTAVLPQSIDGVVSKDLRTLFKDPFMTFNYSRGINSIKFGLGGIIADGLIDKFVSGDMTDSEKKLLSEISRKFGKGKNAQAELIKEMRTMDPNKIYSNRPMGKYKVSLHQYLSDMGTNTYGHLAAQSLETNFAAFNDANVVINKAFNDMFVSYNEKYWIAKEKLEDKKGRGITKKENIALIQSLRKDFPLIKGPYSDKGADNHADSIAIFASENANAKTLEASYGTASTALAKGSKKVQSKVKQLKASLKGGSVIPIHFIDASIIGDTIRSSKGVLGIHDAIIPNLLKTKETVREYNKSVIERNREYSVVGEIITSYKRVIGKSGTDEQKATLQELQDIYDLAQTNRDEIFSSNIDVVHMSAVPGSKYPYEGGKVTTPKKKATEKEAKSKYNTEQIKAIREVLFKPDGTLRAQIRYIADEYNIDMKDC